MNLKAGRAVLCAPRMAGHMRWLQNGAPGVTRPTLCRSRDSFLELSNFTCPPAMQEGFPLD
jgi:hypothetical protein